MRAVIKRMGNSSGVILPRSVLTELGIGVGDSFVLSLEDGRVVLTPEPSHPRAVWAEAAKEVAEAGDDVLV